MGVFVGSRAHGWEPITFTRAGPMPPSLCLQQRQIHTRIAAKFIALETLNAINIGIITARNPHRTQRPLCRAAATADRDDRPFPRLTRFLENNFVPVALLTATTLGYVKLCCHANPTVFKKLK